MVLRTILTATAVWLLANAALAERYFLLIGVDARHAPGSERFVAPDPGPGYPGSFFDGDRLAGTSDGSAEEIEYLGLGTPMFEPNEFGSLSFLFRRGSVPVMGQHVPLMGIEYLGGPLLDLDGDLYNGQRSYIPVEGQSPVIIPGSSSFIELEHDPNAQEVHLLDFDATGCNAGSDGLPPEISTILITIAGTGPHGESEEPPNPDVDTRVGSATPFEGNSGELATVYRIDDLGFELWEDSISINSSSPDVLGTMQFLGHMRGWLIEREPDTGQFPVLTGEGLGSTLWPLVDTSEVGHTLHTANGLAGGSATISDGVPGDVFSVEGNGGLPLTDFGGDLGACLDNVVVPLVPPLSDAFVYLESAGFGINNSFDPVFADTVGWDVVIIAARVRPAKLFFEGATTPAVVPDSIGPVFP